MFSNFQAALKDVFLATVQNEEELSCPIVATALACLIQKYAYAPRFATHAQCLASFGPMTTATQCLSPAELASAGFFHTGRADETVCGTCFVGLRDWQPCDVDAEAVHARFADPGGCLYLTTRRILTSVLPLARKNLSAPRSSCDSAAASAAIDRLAVIAREMKTGEANRCWPVENARALGYSDDLIVLALWRLQSDGNMANEHWRTDPQGTTKLLKAILRVQENGLCDDDLSEPTEQVSEEISVGSTEIDSDSADSVEAEVVLLGHDAVQSQPRLPSLSQMLQWWAKKWLSPKLSANFGGASCSRSLLRRKANSTSA